MSRAYKRVERDRRPVYSPGMLNENPQHWKIVGSRRMSEPSIVVKLRGRCFETQTELTESIRGMADDLDAPPSNKKGSCRSVFEREQKPFLKPLPETAPVYLLEHAFEKHRRFHRTGPKYDGP